MKVFSSIVAGVLLCVPSLAFAQTAAADPQKGGAPTFSKDVAPILQRACQNCHRPESIAPMSLLTYEQTRPWAKAIKTRVAAREMPPWLVERNIGVHQNKFKNDPSLSDAEIQTISTWVDNGAPQGNPADMPPPRTFTDMSVWSIGEPDLVVTMPVGHTVPAEGPNWFGDFTANSGLQEDRYIKAAEAKPGPGAFRVVHHLITSLLAGDESGATFGDDQGGSLVEYALGKNGEVFPDGVGRFMKAGSRVSFNLHYAPVGKETVDRSRVGVKFYPRGYKPTREIIVTPIGNEYDLDFPAGQDNIRTDGYLPLKTPIQITAFQPHMHVRGKEQCLEAIYPNGQPQTIICSKWDFGWHLAYTFQDDVTPLLPAGTILHVISYHNNSTSNKWDPDPRNWVGYGHRTTDDMAFTWLSYFKLTDEEFQTAVNERQAKTHQATQGASDQRR